MEREIKFRAWDGSKMMNQVNILLISENAAYPHDRKMFHNSMQWDEEGLVYNPVLMQFTGLHDKNGKEIYEGDWCIAEFRTKDGIQVIQGNIIMDEFMWCIDCTGCVGDDIFSINRPHNFEVIGNIYENPELI